MRKLDQIVINPVFKDALAESKIAYLIDETIELVFDDRATARKHRSNLDEADIPCTHIRTTTMPGDYSTTAHSFHVIA